MGTEGESATAAMADEQKVFIPPKRVNTDYPVIDTDPHWRRAFRYARAEDWTYGAGMAAVGPAFMLVTERYAPSFSGRGAFGPVFRLSCAVGLLAGAGLVYQRSCLRFYGWTENEREVKLDMREMVDKVKKGEPLYGDRPHTLHTRCCCAKQQIQCPDGQRGALGKLCEPQSAWCRHRKVLSTS